MVNIINQFQNIRLMLAYELYLNNKESKTPVVKAPKLLKKIYVNEDKVGVDSKALEEYGSNVRYDFLQEWLSMPMNTADEDLLNLPYRGTGDSFSVSLCQDLWKMCNK